VLLEQVPIAERDFTGGGDDAVEQLRRIAEVASTYEDVALVVG
jgi:hypothetical protein